MCNRNLSHSKKLIIQIEFGRLSWAFEEGGVLEEVDVEVDGAVEDGEEVREVGDPLHPRGPLQVGFLVLNMSLQV